MQREDGFDRRPIERATGAAHPLRDPVRLGGPLELVEVVLPAPAVHGQHGDEPAACNEPDEQQPPLEVRHQAGG
jgi:hypothetical protein